MSPLRKLALGLDGAAAVAAFYIGENFQACVWLYAFLWTLPDNYWPHTCTPPWR